MPEALLERIIRVSSSAGELVLDPFAGSGTTLAVARRLNRRYLGFELSAEYAERIRQRLKAVKPELPTGETG
jgi:site-specific DNA-methyltransferase (adenine-specific)